MAPTNHALWLKAKQDPEMVIDTAPYPTCSPNGLIIKTTAVSINPADTMIQNSGILLQTHPAILGCDAAGVVQEVGSRLQHRFKPGDHVFGATGPLGDYKYSGFQEYVVLKDPSVAKVPLGVEDWKAVALPLGFNTAASCLFGEETLGLEIPPSEVGEGRMIIVWGASGSVGCCGLQLAVAAGYEVLAIASDRNHEMLKDIGATICFDYRDSGLVSAVVKSLEGKRVVGALAAISNEESLASLCEILSGANAECKVVAAVQPGAEAYAKNGVSIRTNFAVDRETFEGISSKLWEVFLPAALEKGGFQYKPEPEIVGHGLENVQRAMNLLREGVSAKKLVVTL